MRQPVLVLLVVGAFLHPAPSDSVDSHGEPALEDAMDALGRVLDYCERNYRVLNLDAVIGIRMVDGQLTVLLRRLRTGRVQAEPEQLQQIASLQERAAHLADRTLPELERQDKDYYTSK
uniref:Uncharacterized protein n=1 Tax=Branchiostoma floridae TaxID=7739 RepID=C3YWX6_BRAFL|eukprot:XP_002599358.1 hypothetical protein BRAFLDRAFT_64285 [Branchiostoma floridae]